MNFISAIILGLLLMVPISIAENDRLLILELEVTRDNKVSVISYRLQEGDESGEAALGTEYGVELLSAEGAVLHTAYFDASFEAYALPVGDTLSLENEPGEIPDLPAIALDKISVFVKVLYSDEVVKLRVKKGSSVLLEQEVTVCNNNGACESNKAENYLSCADCSSGSSDELCDEIFDNICDPDCQKQAREERDTDCTCGNGMCDGREDQYYCPKDCGSPMNPFLLYGGIALGVFILLVAGIIMWRRSRNKSKENA